METYAVVSVVVEEGADLITPFHEGEIEYFNLILHQKRSLKDHGDEEGVWGKTNFMRCVMLSIKSKDTPMIMNFDAGIIDF